ncbi:hypothetical protein FF38_06317 [Lucilia cuprina]|uniref:Uncharacterized protein n=1 Tax=Lucilia cuprina TaxID=7375 RepID=A0A0L0BVN4_LUCCU|nr:hypothetical protein FF38_06317 [Lucilia cuprina]
MAAAPPALLNVDESLSSVVLPAAEAAKMLPLPFAAATTAVAVAAATADDDDVVLFASLLVVLLMLALTGASILLSESEASGVATPPISPSPSSVVSVAVVCVVFSSIMGSCDVESFEMKFESPSRGVGLEYKTNSPALSSSPSLVSSPTALRTFVVEPLALAAPPPPLPLGISSNSSGHKSLAT